MKTKNIIVIVAAILVLLAVLCVPYERNDYDDGGSVEYKAMIYRLVKWHFYTSIVKENGDNIYHEIYDKTRIYFFPKNLKTFSQQSSIEREKAYKDLYERYEADLLDLKY